ncbi:MAG: ABC transporter permease [Clostridiales bacterium]|nr:MAG: ABC transporter permease [Clostridiales bacterium]
MKKYRGIVFPLAILLLWAVGSEMEWFNTYIVPHPVKVLKTVLALAEDGILTRHLGISLFRVLSGFVITFSIAFPMAVLVGLNKKTFEYLSPFLEFVRHIPPIAMIPLLILWFGIGETSKIAVIILATFFPIFINTVSGISGCDNRLVEVGRTYGFTRWQTLIKIILPQALPSILAGMQLGLGYSWRSLMGAELIAASSGIGYMIIEAEQLSRIDIIFVGIIVIGTLGCGIDYFFLKATNRLLMWEGGNHDRDKNQELIKDFYA